MIRPALPQDASAIAHVHIRSWQQAYRELMPEDYLASLGATLDKRTAFWRQSLDEGDEQVFVAVTCERIIGWIALGDSRDADAEPGTLAEVRALYVLADHWGSGVGRSLWLRARQHLVDLGYQQVTLWVLVQNLRATRFYRSAGLAPDNSSIRSLNRGGQTLEEIRYRSAL